MYLTHRRLGFCWNIWWIHTRLYTRRLVLKNTDEFVIFFDLSMAHLSFFPDNITEFQSNCLFYLQGINNGTNNSGCKLKYNTYRMRSNIPTEKSCRWFSQRNLNYVKVAVPFIASNNFLVCRRSYEPLADHELWTNLTKKLYFLIMFRSSKLSVFSTWLLL